MAKYHIVPNSGKPGVCDPQKTGICKYSKDGQNPEHYNSSEDAKIAYEKIAAAEFGNTLTLTNKNEDTLMYPNPDGWDVLPNEELKIPSESLNTDHGQEDIVEYYKAAYDYYKGSPRIVSRTRVVYIFEDHVIKVPLTDEGEFSNGLEVNTSKHQHLPIAKSEFITINHNGKEMEVMKMEKVQPVIADYKRMPDWVYSVDCGQVGLTSTGELVAYDL